MTDNEDTSSLSRAEQNKLKAKEYRKSAYEKSKRARQEWIKAQKETDEYKQAQESTRLKAKEMRREQYLKNKERLKKQKDDLKQCKKNRPFEEPPEEKKMSIEELRSKIRAIEVPNEQLEVPNEVNDRPIFSKASLRLLD